jgi:hypothetical protein
MTREDIMHMAREATDEYAKENAWRKNFWRFSQEELQRFAALVAEHERAAEREAILAYCEAVCKAQAAYGPPPCWMQLIGFIRARGSK